MEAEENTKELLCGMLADNNMGYKNVISAVSAIIKREDRES